MITASKALDVCQSVGYLSVTSYDPKTLTYAGAAINVEAKAWVAPAVVRASSVHTSVLAASIVNLALIDI